MTHTERSEDGPGEPAEEPNESAWNEEAVEGQLDELEQADEDDDGEDSEE